MNILKFFEKSKEESSELLEFFYCLAEVVNSLKIKYRKSNNILIVNFIKLLEWCRSWLSTQVEDYAQSLTDYIFWQSRQFYLENMRKFVAGELSGSEFVDRVLYSILSDKKEAQSLEENFHDQLTLELDSKSFQFSKIILNLQLPIEAFDDEPEEDNGKYFTEEELREGVKFALIDMEKYFKD